MAKMFNINDMEGFDPKTLAGAQEILDSAKKVNQETPRAKTETAPAEQGPVSEQKYGTQNIGTSYEAKPLTPDQVAEASVIRNAKQAKDLNSFYEALKWADTVAGASTEQMIKQFMNISANQPENVPPAVLDGLVDMVTKSFNNPGGLCTRFAELLKAEIALKKITNLVA